MQDKNTKRVSSQLVWARENGIIPWSWIVDESREPERVSQWRDPANFARTAAAQYRKDAWVDQPVRIEVWSEKGTVRGTVAPVLHEYGVTFQVFHGYGSATIVRSAAVESISDTKPVTVFYIGDYDPSGLHMSAIDLPERLMRYGGEVELVRLALTADDISKTDLPSFPLSSKTADPRWSWYRKQTGMDRCWELDALNPVILRERLETAIVEMIDPVSWDRVRMCEEAEQKSLAMVLGQWEQLNSISRLAHE